MSEAAQDRELVRALGDEQRDGRVPEIVEPRLHLQAGPLHRGLEVGPVEVMLQITLDTYGHLFPELEEDVIHRLDGVGRAARARRAS